MSSAQDRTATDIVDTSPVTVSIGQALSKVRNRMEKNDLLTIPVVDDGRFVGMISYQELMEKKRANPSETLLDDFVHQPPHIEPGHTLIELADIRMNSGRKAFALVDENDRLNGVIAEPHIAFAARDTDELKDVTVGDLMSTDLVTVTAEESHDTARNLMMEHSISRLPVLDRDNGTVTGLLSSNDLLKTLVPSEQMSDGDYKHHKENMSDIPVSEILQQDGLPDGLTIDRDATLRETLGQMEEHGHQEALVIEKDALVGIITLRDVIAHLAELTAEEGLEVSISGTNTPEETEAIMGKVQTQLQGQLGRLLDRPEKLSVHMKIYEKEGTRHKYSLNFKLVDSHGVMAVDSHDWDLRNAVDQGLDELESVLKKRRDKLSTKKRQAEREGKYQ